jgi:drug/metabolite transporter (DMT)-like permease
MRDNMSNNKKPIDPWPYKVSLWLGSAALVIAGIVLVIWKSMDDILAIVVLSGILILLSNFFIYIGMDKPLKDERSKKIGTLSATYSWFITLGFMGFLLISGYWSHRAFMPEELFGLIFIVMILSMLAINAYFGGKADVE